MEIAFYVAGSVAIAATIMAISELNAVHALLYLVVSLLAVAVVFYVLGAPFAAALEVIVYAGAIMVLFVFVMMLLNLGDAAIQQERRWQRPWMWIGPAILSLVLLGEFVLIFRTTGALNLMSISVVPPAAVGASLFTTYLLGVELAAMLLLVGLIGAFHIGAFYRRERIKQ